MNRPKTLLESNIKFGDRRISYNVERGLDGNLRIRAGGEFYGTRKNSVSRFVLLVMNKNNLTELKGDGTKPIECAAAYLLNNFSVLLPLIKQDIVNKMNHGHNAPRVSDANSGLTKDDDELYTTEIDDIEAK